MALKSVSCQTDSIPSFNTNLLQAYHKSGKFCDISIQSTVEDSKEIISCHKVVLATASPFFQQELEKDENRRNIYIEDIDQQTLSTVIEYIYSGGAISLSNGNVFKLFSAAQQFSLQQLQTECTYFIEGLISVPDVTNALNFAQFHSNEKLTNTCIKFMLEHLEQVKQHGFLELDAKSVKLLAEHEVQSGLPSPSPEDILQAVTEWLHKDEEGRQEHAFYLIKDIPLTKISVAVLRKLLREDTFMRSIQVVYNLYVDAVEEIGRAAEKAKSSKKSHKRSHKRPASLLDNNTDSSQDNNGINNEAGASKRQKPVSLSSSQSNASPSKINVCPSPLSSNTVRGNTITKRRRKMQKRVKMLKKWAAMPPSQKSRGYYIPVSVRTPVTQEAANDIGVAAAPVVEKVRLVKKPMLFFVSRESVRKLTQSSIMSLDLESKQVEMVAKIPQGVLNSNNCCLVYSRQKLYCFGGGQVGDTGRCNMGALLVLDLDTKTWDPNLPNIPALRDDVKSIAAADFLYAIGGTLLSGSFPLSTSNEVDEFNLISINCKNWTGAPSMTFSRAEFGVCYASGPIYVVGGSTSTPLQNTPTVTSSMECYIRRNKAWETKSPMLTARRGLAVAAHSHFIYAMGGCNTSLECLNTVEIYDINLDSWLPGLPMSKNRQNFAAGCVDDYIYAIGGDSIDNPTIERFDIRNQVWESMGVLPVNGSLQSMCFVTRLDRLTYKENW